MIYKDEEMEMKYKGLTIVPFYSNRENCYCLEYFRDKGRALLPSAGHESSSIVTRITRYLQQPPIETKSINPSHELICSYEFSFYLLM